mmetsp:Transcript_21055/g.48763  ORF Transcript_21055/g.48763 Transcript_21055/m.48763 type:complete len:205 (+) Transcript_21055:293-907(+)
MPPSRALKLVSVDPPLTYEKKSELDNDVGCADVGKEREGMAPPRPLLVLDKIRDSIPDPDSSLGASFSSAFSDSCAAAAWVSGLALGAPPPQTVRSTLTSALAVSCRGFDRSFLSSGFALLRAAGTFAFLAAPADCFDASFLFRPCIALAEASCSSSSMRSISSRVSANDCKSLSQSVSREVASRVFSSSVLVSKSLRISSTRS